MILLILRIENDTSENFCSASPKKVEVLSPVFSYALAVIQNKTSQFFNSPDSERTAASFYFDFNHRLVCGLAAVAFHLAILKSEELLIDSVLAV